MKMFSNDLADNVFKVGETQVNLLQNLPATVNHNVSDLVRFNQEVNTYQLFGAREAIGLFLNDTRFRNSFSRPFMSVKECIESRFLDYVYADSEIVLANKTLHEEFNISAEDLETLARYAFLQMAVTKYDGCSETLFHRLTRIVANLVFAISEIEETMKASPTQAISYITTGKLEVLSLFTLFKITVFLVRTAAAYFNLSKEFMGAPAIYLLNKWTTGDRRDNYNAIPLSDLRSIFTPFFHLSITEKSEEQYSSNKTFYKKTPSHSKYSLLADDYGLFVDMPLGKMLVSWAKNLMVATQRIQKSSQLTPMVDRTDMVSQESINELVANIQNFPPVIASKFVLTFLHVLKEKFSIQNLFMLNNEMLALPPYAYSAREADSIRGSVNSLAVWRPKTFAECSAYYGTIAEKMFFRKEVA